MSLGNNLYKARRKKGLSQEAVAEALGISRQTISKWETDETLPNVFQAKEMARLYDLSLDELMEYDADVQEIEKVIQNTSEETQKKIDWTKMWAKQYPILGTYTKEVDVDAYANSLRSLLASLEKEYGFNSLDAMLVLKDILGKTWNQKQ